MRERADREPAHDAVRAQSAITLESPQSALGCVREAPVDLPGAQSQPSQAKLERRHVPADVADPELALTQQRPPQRPEGVPCGRADAAAGPDAYPSLERTQACLGHRPAQPIDRTRVDLVRAQRDLERGDPRARLQPGRHPRRRPGQGARTDGTDHRCPAHSWRLRRARAVSCRTGAASRSRYYSDPGAGAYERRKYTIGTSSSAGEAPAATSPVTTTWSPSSSSSIVMHSACATAPSCRIGTPPRPGSRRRGRTCRPPSRRTGGRPPRDPTA